MATNIGNPAFRMVLRRLLVCGTPGDYATRHSRGYATRRRDICLSQKAPKKPSSFLTKFRFFDAFTHLPSLSTLVPEGPLTAKNSEKLHMRHVEGRELSEIPTFWRKCIISHYVTDFSPRMTVLGQFWTFHNFSPFYITPSFRGGSPKWPVLEVLLTCWYS